MSAADRLGERMPPRAASWLRQIDSNARATMATLTRAPRSPMAWPRRAQVLTAALVSAAVLIAAMFVDTLIPICSISCWTC